MSSKNFFLESTKANLVSLSIAIVAVAIVGYYLAGTDEHCPTIDPEAKIKKGQAQQFR